MCNAFTMQSQSPSSTISAQGQLTIPAAIRKHLGVTAGNIVVWNVDLDATGSPRVIVQAGTTQELKRLRGVGKKLYQSYGGGAVVLEQERSAWDR